MFQVLVCIPRVIYKIYTIYKVYNIVKKYIYNIYIYRYIYICIYIYRCFRFVLVDILWICGICPPPIPIPIPGVNVKVSFQVKQIWKQNNFILFFVIVDDFGSPKWSPTRYILVRSAGNINGMVGGNYYWHFRR